MLHYPFGCVKSERMLFQQKHETKQFFTEPLYQGAAIHFLKEL